VEHFLAHLLDKFTYLGIVAVLSAAGLGLPVSEDLTLLIGGALAAKGITQYWPTLAAGYLGVLIGDVLIHHWGKRMGPAAFSQKWVQKVLSPARELKLLQHFARHAFLTIVVGRHTPVLRTPVFFLAGASKVPLWEFLLADAVGAAITVPIVVTLGFLFGEHLDEIRQKIHQGQWVLVGAIAVALLAWLIWRRRRRTRGA
jgi:membrane protein DedA with SNARE-associated domain